RIAPSVTLHGARSPPQPTCAAAAHLRSRRYAKTRKSSWLAKRAGLARLRRPERPQVHRGVAGPPAAEEALDRGVQHDLFQLLDAEQAVAANRGVLRGDGLERTARQIAGEDDVHDVLGREAPNRRDRVDDRDRALDR